MKIGYTRIVLGRSTDTAIRALMDAGCEVVYQDTGSRNEDKRWPKLDEAIASANPGDTLVVFELVDLATSIGGIFKLIHELSTDRVFFASIRERMDTSTPAGSMLINLADQLIAQEKALASERSQISMNALKLSGKTGGRPKTDEGMLAQAQALVDAGMSVRDAAKQLGASQATLYRRLTIPTVKSQES